MSEKVKFIDTDAEATLSEFIADYEGLTGKKLQPGQAEQLLIQAAVNRITLLKIGVNETANQNLVDFALAPAIDYLGALVGVTRLTASAATCIIRFTLVDGHGPLNIPSGIRVQSIDGQLIFITIESVTVEPGDNTADIAASCLATGSVGNDYTPGNISVILDPQAYVSAATNLDTTSGGNDAETDEELRERIKLAPGQFSVAGPENAYKFFAKSAHPLIVDVGILGPPDVPDGEVHIFPLLLNGEAPSMEIIDAVYAACNNEKTRPLTDTVVVEAPTKIDYDIEVNLVLLTTAVQDDVLVVINANLDAYVESRKTKLGLDVVVSKIKALCMVDGVYDVEVVSPAGNVVAEKNEFTEQTTRTLIVTGTSDE